MPNYYNVLSQAEIIPIYLLCISVAIGVVLLSYIYKQHWLRSALYYEVFKNAAVGILLIDSNGRVIECNEKSLEILGSPSLHSTLAINVLTDSHMEQSGLSGVFRSVFANKTPFHIEREYISKWGKQSYLNINILPVSRDKVVVIAEDMTELNRQREEAHRKSIFLRQIIDATHDWIYVRDREHRFVLVNREFADALGQPIDSIVGKRDEDFFNDTAKINLIKIEDNSVMDNRSTMSLGEKQLVDYRTGEKRWFRISKYPIRTNGVVEYVLGVAVDVTESRALLGALRVSERKYSELVETVNTLTLQIDNDGVLVYVSNASMQLLCQDANRLIGKYWWEIVHPDSSSKIQKSFNRWRYMATRHRETMETQVIGCNGFVLTIHWTISILFDSSQFKGLNVQGTDITRRKELEHQLRQSKEAYKQLTENYRRFFDEQTDG